MSKTRIVLLVLLTIAGGLVGLLVGGILAFMVFLIIVGEVWGGDMSTGDMTTGSFVFFIFGPLAALLGAIL